MSLVDCKLVLRALPEVPGGGERKFEVMKSVNTLELGIPGDILARPAVDKILASVRNRGPRNKLTVDFVK